MDTAQTLLALIAGAITIGGVIGIALAYKRKTDLEVLRASNNDYKARNEQLETDIERVKKENAVLEAQRILPFEKLTKLMLNQHSEQLKGMHKLTQELGKLAKAFTKGSKP